MVLIHTIITKRALPMDLTQSIIAKRALPTDLTQSNISKRASSMGLTQLRAIQAQYTVIALTNLMPNKEQPTNNNDPT